MSSFWILCFALGSGVTSAKWAMDLGYSQFRQAIWGFVGTVTGPLALLWLYSRLLRRVRGSARAWF